MIALMYHSISPGSAPHQFAVPVECFAAQMAWLARRGIRGVSAREALLAPRMDGQRVVVLTFDDGYLDNYTCALPVLQEHGFSATVFLPTDYVGRSNDWETHGPPAQHLGWEHVREMSRAGIEFGSHTASHLDPRSADVDTIRRELVDSKRRIEDEIGLEVVSFAYPYGFFRPEMPQLLAEAGYRLAFLAGTYGINRPDTSPYALHRTPIWGRDRLAQFAGKVRGWYWWRHYTMSLCEEARWQVRKHREGRSLT